MTKYVLVYHGEAEMPEAPDEVEAVMAAWGAWFESLGDALVDGGNPFAEKRLLGGDGSVTASPSDLSGYTVVQADDFDGALAAAKGCPILGHGQIEVCEAIDM